MKIMFHETENWLIVSS